MHLSIPKKLKIVNRSVYHCEARSNLLNYFPPKSETYCAMIEDFWGQGFLLKNVLRKSQNRKII